MKQVLQSLKDGKTEVAGVPRPLCGPGEVLIETRYSLISAGTERMLVDFGKAGWLAKARQQPDKVRQVLDKVRTDGLGPTLQAVRHKLDEPVAMGYCNVGTVLETGVNVKAFKAGDRVISNGKHAEVVAVPQNLCALVPPGVEDESAVFAVLGAIGLQGIRLLAPTLGECVVVTGLGLIGLLTVQLLRAHGCRVLGLDYDPSRLALAREFGAETIDLVGGEDPVTAAHAFSRGRGVDGVIVTAATQSSEPMHQAAQMCRKRGRIVLVGVAGLELSRADFFAKELSFQVSCSYGPGRYDPDYEEAGNDYPVGYVRWTEQRNFEAFLDMLAGGQVTVASLLSHRFDIAAAAEAYTLIGGQEPTLGVLLEYPEATDDKFARAIDLAPPAAGAATGNGIGFIGAGNYAGQVLVPAFAKTGAPLTRICSAAGVSATRIGRKYGVTSATTDADAVLSDPDTAAVVIATRHDSHADFTCRALRAGKHVFVEKPLVISAAELQAVSEAHAECGARQHVMVGFNRRFAPHVVELKRLLAQQSAPPAMVMTVNAGAIPADHWTQDPAIGGGRILGEACHFVDLLRFLAASPITSVRAARLGGDAATPADTVTVALEFGSGALGAIHYFANGNKRFPKERLEVFCGGGIIELDNFRVMRGIDWPGFRRLRLARQDKGNAACAQAFVDALRTPAPAPIPFAELVEVHEACLQIAHAVG